MAYSLGGVGNGTFFCPLSCVIVRFKPSAFVCAGVGLIRPDSALSQTHLQWSLGDALGQVHVSNLRCLQTDNELMVGLGTVL